MQGIMNDDFNKYVELVGTAHFTKRSIREAYNAVSFLKPRDIALELDWARFSQLSTICLGCARRRSCEGICEFTSAAEALGNLDANIWLIDMTEQEMRHRIVTKASFFEDLRPRIQTHSTEDPVWLWERGFKDRVLENSKRDITALRRAFPSVWHVLIDERDLLMSARIAWIVSQKAIEEHAPQVLAFVGAAHVDGIRKLLDKPELIEERLIEFKLPFTEPTLVRRVSIHAD